MADEDPWGDGGDEEATPVEPSPAKSGSKPNSKTQTPTAGSKTATPAAGSKAGTPGTGSKAETPTSGSKAASVGAEEAPPPPPQEEKRPIRYYRHWVRPQFLQYKYMYQYRHNYYNDVIDYLEKRDKGINRAIPQPQTWAERVLRTNAERKYEYFDEPPNVICIPRYRPSGRISPTNDYHPREEPHLIITLPAVIKATNYHSKSYINQKYQRVL